MLIPDLDLIFTASPDVVRRETTRLHESMRRRHGHILNLGHGILPSAKPENMQVLCETVAEHAAS
jgi:uroporphyrinogen decarboxylase